MKKIYSLVIFLLLLSVVIFWGSHVVDDCTVTSNGLKICSMCPDRIMNPVIRPASFALLNLPNAIKGEALSQGCNQILSIYFIVFDILYIVILTILIKRILIFIYQNTKKNKQKEKADKIRIFNPNTARGKLFVLICLLMFVLVIVNTAFYFLAPRVKDTDRAKPLGEMFQPEVHTSDDFNGAIDYTN